MCAPKGAERARDMQGEGCTYLQVVDAGEELDVTLASRGSADILEPGFPASKANLAVPGELAVGCAGYLGVRT